MLTTYVYSNFEHNQERPWERGCFEQGVSLDISTAFQRYFNRVKKVQYEIMKLSCQTSIGPFTRAIFAAILGRFSSSDGCEGVDEL